MTYQYRATHRFWKSFHSLEQEQQTSTRRAFHLFRQNPFDPRLKTHRIARLSARAGQTVYSVWIEPDLRAIFTIDGSTLTTLDIGTHQIYR
jgi:mRNA-degrading endonuclease YafQ of YafQ-DinJ toxin-antitoxin module